MKCISLATAVTAALAALGCEPIATTEVEAPQFRRGPVIESVTGSGHFTQGGQLRTFSFSAVKRADGTVTGEWQRFARAIGAKAHGDVTCFSIAGNQAWLGGVVERTTTIPGEVGWTVVDNGQGANSPADQISLQNVGGAPGFADTFCGDQPTKTMFDIEKGNIQIR